VFDALQSIKGIIDKFCMESTVNKEVHIELEEYGLHPEHSHYKPLSIARIKEEYSLPDRSLHVNNNPFYFGVENCSTDGNSSFQPYYIAEIMQRLTSSESLLVNNFEEVREEKREELFKLSETFSTITTSAAITDQDLLMMEMMVMTSIVSV